MWKQYLILGIFLLLFVRFLGTTESKIQNEATKAMDTRCLQIQRSPIHVILWGSSEGIAHNLFEMTQKAECPRKIVFTILENPSEETAAVLYMRAVRMRGTQESSFEDQITWLRTLDSSYRVTSKVAQLLRDIEEPLVVTLFAENQYNFAHKWDSSLWTSLPKMKTDLDLITVVPNAFSRLKPTKKIQVEWIPLHMDHTANYIEVVFPSHCLFGYRLGLLKMFETLEQEWEAMPWKCFPLCASQMQYNFLGQILLESPSKMIQDIDSWNAKLDPKTDALLYKELLSRQPILEESFFERQSLGLDTESASNLEIILKYGSIKELHKNLHHVRSKENESMKKENK